MSEQLGGSSRTVMCCKYGREMEGLATPPLPGPAGEELWRTVSRQAWEEWQGHQTMLINENQLSLRDPQVRSWLKEQMTLFLSGGDYARPVGYKPPAEKT